MANCSHYSDSHIALIWMVEPLGLPCVLPTFPCHSQNTSLLSRVILKLFSLSCHHSNRMLPPRGRWLGCCSSEVSRFPRLPLRPRWAPPGLLLCPLRDVLVESAQSSPVLHGVCVSSVYPESLLPSAGLALDPVLSQPSCPIPGFPSVVSCHCCPDFVHTGGRWVDYRVNL